MNELSLEEFAARYDKLYKDVEHSAAGLQLTTAKQRLWRMAGLKPGMRVLDYGCGSGGMASFPDISYVGIDSSPKAIALARVAHPDKEFRVHQPGKGIEGEFDFFAAGSVFTHVPKADARACLEEIRAVAPLGIVDVLHQFPDNPADWFVRYYWKAEWAAKLKESGWVGEPLGDTAFDAYVHTFYRVTRLERS